MPELETRRTRVNTGFQMVRLLPEGLANGRRGNRTVGPFALASQRLRPEISGRVKKFLPLPARAQQHGE